MQAFYKRVAVSPAFRLMKIVLLLVTVTFACYLLTKLAGLLAPFVLALVCSIPLSPIIRLLERIQIKGHHLPRSVATFIALVVIGGAIGVGVFFLINLLVYQLISFISSLPQWGNELLQVIQGAIAWLQKSIDILPDEVGAQITSAIMQIGTRLASSLSGLVNPAMRGLVNTAQFVPTLLLSVIMWLVGTFYISLLRPRIAGFLSRELPAPWVEKGMHLKKRLFSTLFGYIKAQLQLMGAVCIVILVGLLIMREKYALLLAVIIAIFDALPVIGSGMFLNTWAVYSLLSGDAPKAAGLVLIYVAVVICRNLLEPRVVSVQIGLPPLLTMMAMYLGFRLIGFVGMIAGPILMVILTVVYEYYAQGRSLRQILDGELPIIKEEAEPPEGST